MSEFTFLEEKQIIGDDKLEIFNKYGSKCVITDFAILLGGVVNNYEHTKEGDFLDCRTGAYWTKDSAIDNSGVVIIDTHGSSRDNFADYSVIGSRPAVPYSSIEADREYEVFTENGMEVGYGCYPQTVADFEKSNNLESLYNSNSLTKTGNKYTTDSIYNVGFKSVAFKAREFEEYELQGAKYIRVLVDSMASHDLFDEKLSDGRVIEAGGAYWVKVEPIFWQVDKKNNIAVSKKILFAGIKFDNQNNYDGNFDKTNIKRFI